MKNNNNKKKVVGRGEVSLVTSLIVKYQEPLREQRFPCSSNETFSPKLSLVCLFVCFTKGKGKRVIFQLTYLEV